MKRFSIAGLMGVVVVFGVAVAALKNATELWLSVMLTVTLLSLAISFVGILNRRGVKRAFWQGFAIFGWGYLLLALGPWAGTWVEPYLPTSHFLGYLHGKVHPAQANPSLTAAKAPIPVDTPPNGLQIPPPPVEPPAPFVGYFDNKTEFTYIGHCLFSLVAALTGGLIAIWFCWTNRSGQDPVGSA